MFTARKVFLPSLQIILLEQSRDAADFCLKQSIECVCVAHCNHRRVSWKHSWEMLRQRGS